VTQLNADDVTQMHRARMSDELRKQRRRARDRKLLDGRTRLQRRIRALRDSYLAAIGEAASPELRDRCERAAQLVALAEDARCKALGGGIGLDHLEHLVRIENIADRAVRGLGVDRRREPERSSLAEHLAKRAAERGGSTTGGPA
jgi:hypothetical protein